MVRAEGSQRRPSTVVIEHCAGSQTIPEHVNRDVRGHHAIFAAKILEGVYSCMTRRIVRRRRAVLILLVVLFLILLTVRTRRGTKRPAAFGTARFPDLVISWIQNGANKALKPGTLTCSAGSADTLHAKAGWPSRRSRTRGADQGELVAENQSKYSRLPRACSR